MGDSYESREDLMEQRDDLEEALGIIVDECQKESPDLEFIESTASEALGIDDEDGGDSNLLESEEDE